MYAPFDAARTLEDINETVAVRLRAILEGDKLAFLPLLVDFMAWPDRRPCGEEPGRYGPIEL